MQIIALHSWKHDIWFQLNIPIGAAIFSDLSNPLFLWDSLWDSWVFFPPHIKSGKICVHSHRCLDVSCELGTTLLQPETATVQLISGLCFPGPRPCPQRLPLKFRSCQSATSVYNVRVPGTANLIFRTHAIICTQVMILFASQMLACYYILDLTVIDMTTS